MILQDESRTSTNRIALVILASGESRRFGENKLLQTFPSTTTSNVKETNVSALPLWRYSVNAALTQFDPSDIYIVSHELTRNKILELQKTSNNQDIIKLWQQAIINTNPSDGMSGSIALAIEKIEHQSTYAAALFILADQPLITARHLKRLVRRFEQESASIIASQFVDDNCQHVTSPPCLFAREHFDELLKLSGDRGAISIIKQHKLSVAFEEIYEAKFDVDTPQQLKSASMVFMQAIRNN